MRGVTPDLFYGSATHDESGRLIPQPGLRDCLSVYGSDSMIDINHAEPPVLAAIGLPPDVITQIIAHRTAAALSQAGRTQSSDAVRRTWWHGA